MTTATTEFPTFDLTTSVTSCDVAEALLPLFQPGIADGSIERTRPSDWVSRDTTICPKSGDVLQVSLSQGGNEGWHLTIRACLQVEGIRKQYVSSDEPQWLPLITAKVWSKQAGAQLAGQILLTTADAFIW